MPVEPGKTCGAVAAVMLGACPVAARLFFRTKAADGHNTLGFDARLGMVAKAAVVHGPTGGDPGLLGTAAGRTFSFSIATLTGTPRACPGTAVGTRVTRGDDTIDFCSVQSP